MIYICAENSNKSTQTQSFANKGLSGLTTGRISAINLFAKATYTQIAHSGYKDAIEAFLHATAVQKKVSTREEHYPIPSDYKITTPLPFPPIVFQLAQSTSPDQIDRIMKAWASTGIQLANVGKGNPTFTMERPTWKLLSSSIPAIANPRCIILTGYCQMEAVVEVLVVYQCIDLFLATNTYSYKRETDEGDVCAPYLEPGGGSLMECRMKTYYYRPGYEKASKKSKTIEGPSGVKDLEMEENDLTPHRDGMVPLQSSVLVAK